MSSITFDTLKFANRLKEAGVPVAQAEAEASALAEALGSTDVATKHDLAEMKFELLKWIVGLALAQFSVLIGILLKVSG
jgi:hypothetical protein